jgi:hypothetical protein
LNNKGKFEANCFLRQGLRAQIEKVVYSGGGLGWGFFVFFVDILQFLRLTPRVFQITPLE